MDAAASARAGGSGTDEPRGVQSRGRRGIEGLAGAAALDGAGCVGRDRQSVLLEHQLFRARRAVVGDRDGWARFLRTTMEDGRWKMETHRYAEPDCRRQI